MRSSARPALSCMLNIPVLGWSDYAFPENSGINQLESDVFSGSFLKLTFLK
jgi:hypothetical protein